MVAAKAHGKIPDDREEELWGQASVQALGNQPHTENCDWERGAEPAQSLDINHNHGCEDSVAESVPHRQAGSAPKGNIFICF